jgi:putative endonuclease
MTLKQKRQTYDRGLFSEKCASIWLLLKGYRILEQRYKTKVGEVDLIVSKNKTIAFVEVKARPTKEQALESITPQMRHRIARTAEYYMSHNDVADYDFRFDVVAVMPFSFRNIIGGQFFIHHLDNAWERGA